MISLVYIDIAWHCLSVCDRSSWGTTLPYTGARRSIHDLGGKWGSLDQGGLQDRGEGGLRLGGNLELGTVCSTV